MTGAYRRDAGLAALERDIVKAQRTGAPFTLAFADVVGLKATNDHAGHAAGDQLLAQVAALQQSAVREYDLLVRYGGDEFLCGLAGVDRETAGPGDAGVQHLRAGRAQPLVVLDRA